MISNFLTRFPPCFSCVNSIVPHSALRMMSSYNKLQEEVVRSLPGFRADFDNLIFEWNTDHPDIYAKALLHDETLRDGLQSPQVKQPSLEEKLKIVDYLESLGINSIDIGFPAASPTQYNHCLEVVKHIKRNNYSILPGVAGRTHPNDIQPCLKLFHEAGVSGYIYAFLGSSSIRQLVEKWDKNDMEKITRQSVRSIKEAGVHCAFVTEDTTRTDPNMIKRLYGAAIEEGAATVTLCDTVGHSTPSGIRNLFTWFNAFLNEMNARDQVRVEFHGHTDRGLGLINSLVALEAGCDMVHGTILGIGERCGNVSLNQLLVNLHLLSTQGGQSKGRKNIKNLGKLVSLVSSVTDTPIPNSEVAFGDSAFLTATGVHAAAVRKALIAGNEMIANGVYSGVPAHLFGLKQRISVGPFSGLHNVLFRMEELGLGNDMKSAEGILEYAKNKTKALTDEEIIKYFNKINSEKEKEAPH